MNHRKVHAGPSKPTKAGHHDIQIDFIHVGTGFALTETEDTKNNPNEELDMTTNILITGAGGPAAVSLIKALEGLGHTLFAVDMDECATGLYMVPDGRRGVVPAAREEGFLIALHRFCARWDIDVLIPTVDAELLNIARHRTMFENYNIKVLLPSTLALECCLDKWVLANLCAPLVHTPKTMMFDDTFVPEDIGFPMVIKPRKGSGSRGIHICWSRDELNKLPRNRDTIAQAYLPGEEYSVDVLLSDDGEVVASVPRLRMKVDSGVCVASRTLHDLELQNIAVEAARCVGLTGVANVQLKRDRRGIPHLMEINPRFPGTMSLTVASGINIPALAVGACLGAPLPQGPLPFEDVVMVRHWEEIYLAPNRFEPRAEAPTSPLNRAH